MKTKSTFLTLVSAAVILVASREQGFAPTGYVNVIIRPGLNLIANPLNTTNNNANNIIIHLSSGPPNYDPFEPDGSVLFRFDSTTQQYMDAATYFTDVGWYPVSGNTNDPVLVLNPGEGFFIRSVAGVNWNITFVGDVPQGWLTNPIPANFSLKASMVPQGGNLQTTLGFPAVEGDEIWRYNKHGQGGLPDGVPDEFTSESPYWYLDQEWSDSKGWPGAPTIEVGEGFFVWRDPALATPENWWIRNFVVNRPSPATRMATSDSTGPDIRSLSIANGTVTLNISNPDGQPYDVQFSTDGSSWKTLARNQTGPTWTGPYPGGAQGHYQVVKP